MPRKPGTATEPSPGTSHSRVGIGYDSHRFAPGGPLVLGGVRIEADVLLHGHSDGDAIAHALTDAVLGAAGAGDIGTLFPDTAAENAGRMKQRGQLWVLLPRPATVQASR